MSEPVLRRALVTGGSGGIGAAVVRALARQGVRVALTYRVRDREASAVAAEIGGSAYRLDLRSPEETRELVDALARDGGVDILVLNAGIIRDALLPFLSEDDWDAVLDVNLNGAYRLTKALVKGMMSRRWGRIISIASASGLVGQVGQTHYSAAKAGLIGFTKALAREVATFGVTANAVAPGFVDTEILSGLSPEKLQEYLKGVPLRRIGTPREVAAMVAFLASDDASYVTGQTICVDGGLVMS